MARSPGRSLFLRMSRRTRSAPTSKTAFSALRFRRPRAPRRRRSRLRQLPHSCQVSGRVSPAVHGAQKLFGVFGGPGLEGAGKMFEQFGFVPGEKWALAVGIV